MADDVAVDLDIADDAAFTDVFPARFELRLDESDHGTAFFEQRFHSRHDFQQGNEGYVNGNEIDRFADICDGDVADIGPFHIDDAVIGPQLPGQLAIADIDGKDLGRPALEAQSVKPPVEAPISIIVLPVKSMGNVSMAFSNFRPPRPT